ncbi:MAG: VCBS repeat-containing protein [Polyangiaceae bacterium]|nr:VCBS repeat-containing protein [Polyangiaceae bacterium]
MDTLGLAAGACYVGPGPSASCDRTTYCSGNAVATCEVVQADPSCDGYFCDTKAQVSTTPCPPQMPVCEEDSTGGVIGCQVEDLDRSCGLVPIQSGLYAGFVADVNHDGYLDFIDTNHETFTVALGTADGTFSALTPQSWPDNLGFQLALGDVNGDGNPTSHSTRAS